MIDELLRTRILGFLVAREKNGPNAWLDSARIAKEIALDARLVEQQIKVLEKEHLVEAHRWGDGVRVRLASYGPLRPKVTQRIFLLRRVTDWSRGDWFAAVGVVIALIACVAAILAVPGLPKVFQLDKAPSARIALELLDPYSGFEITVSNQGRIAAQGIEVELSV